MMAENPILNDRYRLMEQIGSGGMAVLYKAHDLELDRTVAIKVLRPSLGGDIEFIDRFRREARSAANLSHPNIVTVHDVGQDGKTYFIVMEYVPGQDLKKLIRARGAFDVDSALAITSEVCKGVGYAHRAGLVHCDIKPQNILVTPDNSIKVVDFGIARAVLSVTQAGAYSQEDVVWGSPHYFAPEQALGEAPDPASDVYSIGVVLFELVTGRLPYIGHDYKELAMAHISGPIPAARDINPAVPEELEAIITKTLSKEPAGRYRTADQLGRILQTYRARGIQPTSSFVVNESQPMPAANSASAPAPAKPATPIPPPPSPSSPPIPARSGPAQQAAPTIQPRGGRVPASQEANQGADRTVISLPPVGAGRYASQVPAAPAPAAAYSAGYRPPAHQGQDEPLDDFIPGVDVYGIALGIMAAVLLLGLIPLWISVYLTLTR